MNIETNTTPEDPQEPEGRRTPPLPIIGGLIAVVVIGVALVVLALGSGGRGSGGGNSGEALHAGLQTEQPTPEATLDLTNRAPPPEVVDNNLTAVGSGDKIIISKFGVSAPLTYR